jgi:hypothetical protein
MSISKSDTAKLLAFCAAYDQRTIGKSDVEAWAEALDSPWVPNIDLDEAQAAVVAHYRETSQRINVADVLKRVKAWRAEQIGGLMVPRRPGVPATDEYRRIRAEWEARPHPHRRRPDGVA